MQSGPAEIKEIKPVTESKQPETVATVTAELEIATTELINFIKTLPLADKEEAQGKQSILPAARRMLAQYLYPEEPEDKWLHLDPVTHKRYLAVREKFQKLFPNRPNRNSKPDLFISPTDKEHLLTVSHQLFQIAMDDVIDSIKQPPGFTSRQNYTRMAKQLLLTPFLDPKLGYAQVTGSIVKIKRQSNENNAGFSMACETLAKVFHAVPVQQRLLLDQPHVSTVNQNLSQMIEKSSSESKSAGDEKAGEQKLHNKFLKELNLLEPDSLREHTVIYGNVANLKTLFNSIKDFVTGEKPLLKEDDYKRVLNSYKLGRKIRKMIEDFNSKTQNPYFDTAELSLLFITNFLQKTIYSLSVTQEKPKSLEPQYFMTEEDTFTFEEMARLTELENRYDVTSSSATDTPVEKILVTNEQLVISEFRKIQGLVSQGDAKGISERVQTMVQLANYEPGKTISELNFLHLFQAFCMEATVGLNVGEEPLSQHRIKAIDNVLKLLENAPSTILHHHLAVGLPLYSYIENLQVTFILTYNVHMERFSKAIANNYRSEAKQELELAMQVLWFFTRYEECHPTPQGSASMEMVPLLYQLCPDFYEVEGRTLYACVCEQFSEIMRLIESFNFIPTYTPIMSQALEQLDSFEVKQRPFVVELEQRFDVEVKQAEELEAKRIAAEKKAEENYQSFIKQAEQKKATQARKAAEKKRNRDEAQSSAAEASSEHKEEETDHKHETPSLPKKENLLYDPSSPQGEFYDHARTILQAGGKYQHVKPLYDEAIKEAKNSTPKDHLMVAMCLAELAECKLKEVKDHTTSSRRLALLHDLKKVNEAGISYASLIATKHLRELISYCAEHLPEGNVNSHVQENIKSIIQLLSSKIKDLLVVYDPRLIPASEEFPLADGQFYMSLDKKSDQADPDLIYEVVLLEKKLEEKDTDTAQVKIVSGRISAEELKQALQNDYSGFLTAITEKQDSKKLREILNKSIIRITEKRGHTLRGPLNEDLDWLKQQKQQDEDALRKLNASRKKVGPLAEHHYEGVVLMPEGQKSPPDMMVPNGKVVLTKEGDQVTAAYKKHGKIVRETMKIDRPSVLNVFPGKSKKGKNKKQPIEKNEKDFIFNVGSSFNFLSKEHSLKQKLEQRVAATKGLIKELEHTHMYLKDTSEILLLVNAHESPNLLEAPKAETEQKAKEPTEQKRAVTLFNSGRALTFFDGLRRYRDEKNKPAAPASAPTKKPAQPTTDLFVDDSALSGEFKEDDEVDDQTKLFASISQLDNPKIVKATISSLLRSDNMFPALPKRGSQAPAKQSVSAASGRRF